MTTDYGIDVEAELTAASRQILKEELVSVLQPFIKYKNNPVTRNHAENMVKAWLSFKHKMKPQLVGDYAVRCDIFNNQDPDELTIDVAVSFRYTETSGPENVVHYTGLVFVPIRIPLFNSVFRD